MASVINGVTRISATLNDTLIGTNLNDRLKGYADATYMAGGQGDDVYTIVNSKNIVVEKIGEGIDTVQTYVSYELPANVENLIVMTDKSYGGGNELNNTITGLVGAQQLFGAGGDDILTGGAGDDIFIMRPGNGNDTITDFEAGLNGGDKVRLSSYGFTSFDQVKANMIQNGTSVVLKMGAEKLTFLNHKVADFAADDFQYSLDLSKYKITFNDDFNSLNLQTDGGAWRTSFYADGTLRTLSSNGEKQIYMDSAYKGLGVDPFSVKDGILTIHAEKSSDAVKAATGFDYTSGMLSSKSAFAQTYGYFEIKCALPMQNGTWPAFWLLPQDGTWPPELDVFENIGREGGNIYTTSHTNETGKHTSVSSASFVSGGAGSMHTYGLLWTKESLIWSIDGEEVFRTATPADMHKPMYMITNLAVGGYWPGNPDADFKSADMQVDYIRAYGLDGKLTTPTSPPSVVTPPVDNTKATTQPADQHSSPNDLVSSPVSYKLAAGIEHLTLTGTANIDGTGNDLDNIITGNSGNNTLVGGGGHDTLIGGGGFDKLIGGLGNDTYVVSDERTIIVELDNQGADTVKSSVSFMLSNGVENLELTGSALKGTGNILDNILTGNAQNNYLGGLAGNDTLFGYGGNDNLDGGKGNDTLFGGDGNDRLQGGAGDDIMTGGKGDDTFLFLRTETGAYRDKILDFEGAGVSGGDLLNFHGFGKGSSLTLMNSETKTGGTLHLTYDLYDTTTGTHNMIEIDSLNGKKLTVADYAFYS